MAITHSWSFSSFSCYPEHEGQADVVFLVHYTRQANDEVGHSAIRRGGVRLQYAPGQPFVPFASLTPELVAGWVEGALGAATVAEIDAALAAQVAEQASPTRVTHPAPWA